MGNPSTRARRWRCPKCKRSFARANQWHSCKVVPVSVHLAKASPTTRATYDALIEAIRACGPARMPPTKTGINLMAETSFGGIQIRRHWIDLGLLLTRHLRHERVRKVERLSAHSYVHRIRLHGPEEVDAELGWWVRESYAVGRMAGRR